MTTAGGYFLSRLSECNVSSWLEGLLKVLVQGMCQQFLWDVSELLIRVGYPCPNWTFTVNQALLSSFVVRDPVQADTGCRRQSRVWLVLRALCEASLCTNCNPADETSSCFGILHP